MLTLVIFHDFRLTICNSALIFQTYQRHLNLPFALLVGILTDSDNCGHLIFPVIFRQLLDISHF